MTKNRSPSSDPYPTPIRCRTLRTQRSTTRQALEDHRRRPNHPPPPLRRRRDLSRHPTPTPAGPPPLGRHRRPRPPPSFQQLLPPFQTLTRSIINQQFAFNAAAATYSRFVALCGGDESSVTPAVVLNLLQSDLRQIGISSRKDNYLKDLARKFHTEVLSDELILNMDDKSVISMLTMVEGIGTWSAHMFLIFSLHRPDVLPVGDGGVRRGVQVLYGLEEVPRPSQMEKICKRWRPYRSVGSWYMCRLSEAKASVGSSGGGGVEIEHHHQSLLLDNIQDSSVRRRVTSWGPDSGNTSENAPPQSESVQDIDAWFNELFDSNFSGTSVHSEVDAEQMAKGS